MSGLNRTSHDIIIQDAATITERSTYAQAAAQTQSEKREEKESRKGKEEEVRGTGRGPSKTPPESEQGADLPQRFTFVEDMSEYEEEECRKTRCDDESHRCKWGINKLEGGQSNRLCGKDYWEGYRGEVAPRGGETVG